MRLSPLRRVSGALLLFAFLGLTPVYASSHREALAILDEPCADNTDTFAWVSNSTHERGKNKVAPAQFAGAERIVKFFIDRLVETRGGSPLESSDAESPRKRGLASGRSHGPLSCATSNAPGSSPCVRAGGEAYDGRWSSTDQIPSQPCPCAFDGMFTPRGALP